MTSDLTPNVVKLYSNTQQARWNTDGLDDKPPKRMDIGMMKYLFEVGIGHEIYRRITLHCPLLGRLVCQKRPHGDGDYIYHEPIDTLQVLLRPRSRPPGSRRWSSVPIKRPGPPGTFSCHFTNFPNIRLAHFHDGSILQFLGKHAFCSDVGDGFVKTPSHRFITVYNDRL